MTKRIFYIFILLFFLVINYSVSTIKTAFFERSLFFLLFISLFLLFRHIDLTRAFVILTAFISFFVFSYGIVQKYILFPIYLNNMGPGVSTVSKAMKARIESGRIFSIFSLPTLYTFICAVLLLAIFHYLINSEKNITKVFWVILLLAGIFNIVLTQSFAGVLYLLIGFPVYLYISGRSSLKFMLPLLMTLFMFLFIISGMRFQEAKKFDPLKLRISNWNQAVRVIETSPLLGIGFGNYESQISQFIQPGEARSIYSHNFLLQITAEGGIIIVLSGFFLLFLFKKKITPEFSKENALYLSILTIILLYNLIDIGLYFFSASLLFALILSQIYRKESTLPKSVILISFVLIIPQTLIFISSGIRRTGSFHLNFGRFGQAEQYFLKSLRCNRFNHKSLMGMAKTSYSSGNTERADEYLQDVISLNVLTPYAHFLRSRILYMKKKYLSSFYHAGKAISLNKKNKEYSSWFEFIRTNLGKNLKRSESPQGEK